MREYRSLSVTQYLYANTFVCRVWDMYGQCMNTLKGHTGSVKTVAISPDGNTIVSGSSDKSVR